MELTSGAAFLNNAFAQYDSFILSILHAVNCKPLTFLFRAITFIGEKGIVFFLAAIILMLFSKTRKTGICLFGAVACGALITNIILKDAIARPRPFNAEPFLQWWHDIGSPAEEGFSFPSGHVTAAAAGMTALRIRDGRKWTVPGIIWIVIMAIARNYLMAHYPSDVLFACIIGIASGFIAAFITDLIYEILRHNRNKEWSRTITGWNFPDIAGIPSRIGLIGNESAKRPHKAEEKRPARSDKYAGKHSR